MCARPFKSSMQAEIPAGFTRLNDEVYVTDVPGEHTRFFFEPRYVYKERNLRRFFVESPLLEQAVIACHFTVI